MSGWNIFVDVFVLVAAIVAILDYFGVKPKQRSDGGKMSLSRGWKLVLMLMLVAISLGLSGYGFYRSLRPKIVVVEKPVDRIVEKEKLVQSDCSHVVHPKKNAEKKDVTHKDTLGPLPSPIQQDCGGGNCAASVGQQGGITAGQINIAPPDRHLTLFQKNAITDFVRGKHCKIDMLSGLANAPDAQNYALEIAAAFRDGGCDAPKECNLGVMPSGTLRGIEIIYHDDAIHQPGQMILISKETQEGIVAGAFDNAKIPVSVNTSGGKGVVRLLVGAP
jgi:hypothetical protein